MSYHILGVGSFFSRTLYSPRYGQVLSTFTGQKKREQRVIRLPTRNL